MRKALFFLGLLFATNLHCQEGTWSLDGGVTYQVIVDEFIDAEDATISISMRNLSLTSVDMIVEHKDGKTRFTFKNFKKGGNNKITNAFGKPGPYDWFMIKKGKFRRWMEKSGKRDIANYLEKNIEKVNDEWE